jgi:hypothetical protein
MTSTAFTAEKFQIGAGLSGYVAELGSCFLCADLGIVPEWSHVRITQATLAPG